MYDPSIGRWLTEDPTGFDAGDTDLYRYVGNDPTNATDPSGLLSQNLTPQQTWDGWENQVINDQTKAWDDLISSLPADQRGTVMEAKKKYIAGLKNFLKKAENYGKKSIGRKMSLIQFTQIVEQTVQIKTDKEIAAAQKKAENKERRDKAVGELKKRIKDVGDKVAKGLGKAVEGVEKAEIEVGKEKKGEVEFKVEINLLELLGELLRRE